jgi:hypothetical protein
MLHLREERVPVSLQFLGNFYISNRPMFQGVNKWENSKNGTLEGTDEFNFKMWPFFQRHIIEFPIQDRPSRPWLKNHSRWVDSSGFIEGRDVPWIKSCAKATMMAIRFFFFLNHSIWIEHVGLRQCCGRWGLRESSLSSLSIVLRFLCIQYTAHLDLYTSRQKARCHITAKRIFCAPVRHSSFSRALFLTLRILSVLLEKKMWMALFNREQATAASSSLFMRVQQYLDHSRARIRS